MSGLIRTLLVSIAMVHAVGATAGTIRDDIDPAIHLALGDLPVFDSVGLLEGTFAGGGGFGCSGTLVGSSWAVTAAHCVDEAASLEFTVGGETYTADGWGAHPGWLRDNPLNLIIGNDIGMIHLANPVTNVTPAERYRGSNEVGMLGFNVGFGNTGTGTSGAVTQDGQKRAGANVLDTYFFGDAETSRVVLADFDNPNDPGNSFTGSPEALPIEYLIAPGDSGGGLFVPVEGEFLLAGVHSFVLGLDLTPDSDYGDIAGSTRVSRYNDWIDAVLGLTPDTVANPAPSNLLTGDNAELGVIAASAVPLPPAVGLLVLALTVLSGCRRRAEMCQLNLPGRTE